jgi:hypothetical protein
MAGEHPSASGRLFDVEGQQLRGQS